MERGIRRLVVLHVSWNCAEAKPDPEKNTGRAFVTFVPETEGREDYFPVQAEPRPNSHEESKCLWPTRQSRASACVASKRDGSSGHRFCPRVLERTHMANTGRKAPGGQPCKFETCSLGDLAIETGDEKLAGKTLEHISLPT